MARMLKEKAIILRKSQKIEDIKLNLMLQSLRNYSASLKKNWMIL